MYKYKETNKYIYSIDINLSDYKFTFIPMVYLKIFGNSCFNLEIGWGTLFIEIVKINHISPNDMENLFEKLR